MDKAFLERLIRSKGKLGKCGDRHTGDLHGGPVYSSRIGDWGVRECLQKAAVEFPEIPRVPLDTTEIGLFALCC